MGVTPSRDAARLDRERDHFVEVQDGDRAAVAMLGDDEQPRPRVRSAIRSGLLDPAPAQAVTGRPLAFDRERGRPVIVRSASVAACPYRRPTLRAERSTDAAL